ncbi:hypothetical protein C3941_09355 [Kaistia algarum]|uniref:VpaChn25_0724 family phage protein n=1 Tax=Kaistia algarum TaxID=2083279 RepID=UPI000CE8680C|nr:hypothetical protein [Kaistia algarum]MCX5512266.1 hypothetical protein [Kaistia algarum]PPE80357.1 hypothetical protein C3941_09355 [Kaistia algarum]
MSDIEQQRADTLRRKMREEARLIMLRALADEINETLTSSRLVDVLDMFGIYKERSWVHDELAWMAEAGAVTLTDAGTVKIARLTEKGSRHLDRRIAIEGIRRPSRPEV